MIDGVHQEIMVETTTIGVQVFEGSNKAEGNFQSAIVSQDGDMILIKTENPRLKVQFNYVPMLEFLYQVEAERRKVKMQKK